ncbi:hypothetical protein GCM10010174_11610 [Kutzneria viridogrisea]|uniref:Lipoprotein LprG n=1 Tax=Kutzneria viridogrisea TaxID=47990 RepID=A0ABR6BHY9_9PSEU|nr:hypothetical protein [Kutzneria viridogrisea]
MRVRGVVAAVAAVLAVSGCTVVLPGQAGTDPAVAPPAQHDLAGVLSAVGKLGSSHGATFSYEGSYPSGEHFTATGRLNRDNQGLRMACTVEQTYQGASLRTELVLQDHAVYVKPGESWSLPPDRPWVRESYQSTDKLMGELGPVVNAVYWGASAELARESVFTQWTKLVGSSVEPVGTTPARKYLLDVDLRALAASPVQGKAAFTRDTQQMSRLVETLSFGARDVPVRIGLDQYYDGIPPIKSSVTYRDWGTPVTVTVPADSQLSPPPA